MQFAETIRDVVNEYLKNSEVFLVGVKVAPGNKKIQIVLDGDKGISIEDCTRVSRHVSEVLENDERMQDVHHLDVSSPGATEPLLLLRQYPKHIGRKLQVQTTEGELIKGKLAEIGNQEITLVEQKKNTPLVQHRIRLDQVKEARVMLEF
jgi:ribosome maturation factor RimP